MCRAKRGPSNSGDGRSRGRRIARYRSSRAPSCVNSTAFRTYSNSLSAINSSMPRLASRNTPLRPTSVRPASVTSGTPIHNASKLVVCPE